MGYDLDETIRNWKQEVEAEAVKLITAGTPPFDAMVKARNIVSQRRAAKALEG